MAFGTRQAARGRPAPVSVHDDRHMQRDGSIRSFRGGGGGVRHYLNSRTNLDSWTLPSNGEDFLFLRRKQLIDFRNRSVGRLLHLVGEPLLIVFGNLVILLALLD